jgi:hypothetical protein
MSNRDAGIDANIAGSDVGAKTRMVRENYHRSDYSIILEQRPLEFHL